ncbi:MAG: tRNA pseudouridine(38-40) synthase TruA [Acidobacteria bacterium]|nr:tRNA pseudouridine(38-40) synthase TruA [Acidobacteriota bacterium]
MPTWKLILEYDGTRYSGWQEQKNARTLQGELRAAAEALLGAAVEMQGSGRTDAGVHALAQVVHMRVSGKPRLDELALRRELNKALPSDMAVLAIEPAAPAFHARHNALTRIYLYRISTRKTAFSKRHVWWVKRPLETAAMARAARILPGRHDFRAFRAEDAARPGESTIVVVDRAEVEPAGDEIRFRIEASHFLWRMVRRVVGALVKVGLGELPEDDFRRLIEDPAAISLPVAEWTAPACGLFLEQVRYPDPARMATVSRRFAGKKQRGSRS